MAVSFDGCTAEVHGAFRRVPGSNVWTLGAVGWARELGLPVQINTTATQRNLADFDPIARLLESFDIGLWSVFFPVPTGRGQDDDLISAEELESVLQKLHSLAGCVPFDIKTTEAEHYHRYLAQARAAEGRHSSRTTDSPEPAPLSGKQHPDPAPPPTELAAPRAGSTTRAVLSSFPTKARFSQRPPDPFRRQRSSPAACGNLLALTALRRLARHLGPEG